MKLFFSYVLLVLLVSFSAVAQDADPAAPVKKKAPPKREVTVKDFLAQEIINMTGEPFHGRGYVKNGVGYAAKYLQTKFRKLGLRPGNRDSTYAQGFAFSVNTFPGQMVLSFNGDDALIPGEDFLIDPGSPSFVTDTNGKGLKIKKVDLARIHDTADWAKQLAKFDSTHAYVLKNVDLFCKDVLDIPKSAFAAELPKGCYIIPEEKKLTWSVSREVNDATVFYVREGLIPKKFKNIGVNVQNEFITRYHNDNILGILPGDEQDSFLVFTAHYDHLGHMGDSVHAVFPGASDNASGTAMMLYLADYFAKHPHKYTMLFIAFAGEEAGLMGSEFYLYQPTVSVTNIKYLVNLDIMGDAKNGITIVNALKNQELVDTLKQINLRKEYLPYIKLRDNAANSDHYHFSKAGVPSVFIYSNGGDGHYHDVYDKARAVSLYNIDRVAALLIDLVNSFNPVIEPGAEPQLPVEDIVK